MHDAGDLNDLINQNPHNVHRGIYGLFLGVLVLFSQLASTHAQQITEELVKQAPHSQAVADVAASTTTFTTITAVSGFVVCLFSMIRFIVDMYDRFIKPNRKRGKTMPGGGDNPKFQKVIKAAKALVAPAKKPNRFVAVGSLLALVYTGRAGFMELAAPISVHIDTGAAVVTGVLFVVSAVLALKHI